MNYTLENQSVKAVFNDRAEFLELLNVRTGTHLIRPHGLWRMIVREGENLEVEVLPENSRPEVTATADSIRFRYAELNTQTGTPLRAEFEIAGTLDCDRISWDIRLENNTADIQIREIMFPILNLSAETEAMPLHWSYFGGEVIPDIRSRIQNSDTKYRGMDECYLRFGAHYPYPCATNSFTFNSGREGLHLASCDPAFQDTQQFFEQEKSKEINAFFIKYPFLNPGETVEIKGYITSAYCGAWHVAADQYRKWADSWFRPAPTPDGVRRMRGWQRIIARTQYGANLFRYDEFPRIFEDGIKAGIDTLFLFGWHRGGHDCDYPNYVPSEELGGKEKLKDNVRKFQEKGGRVILYANGQLIDRNSDFYRTAGHRISTKNLNGNEQQHFYAFSGCGTAQNYFGNRTFAVACSASNEWLEVLKSIADTAAELGCDGIFFDQLGANATFCCDPSHGHPVPFTAASAARGEMIRKLRSYVNTRYPAMSFGIEIISDLTACHADYIHTLAGGAAVVNPDWEAKEEKPRVLLNLDYFRYMFPEIPVSDREIRDDTDIERRVNRTIMSNLFSDVEIYRCRKTIAETPHYQEYLGRINRFRKQYAGLLDGARFRSTALHACDNTEIDSAGHLAASGEVVVIATQSHKAELSAEISVPGKRLVRHGVFGSGSVEHGGRVCLRKHDLAIMVFQ